MDIVDRIELFEGWETWKGSRSYARQKYTEGIPKHPSWEKSKGNNNDDFQMLNGIRIALNIRKGNEFFLSVNSFPNVSDKQLATCKKILMSTPPMKKLLKMAKSISQEEAMSMSMEKVKKKDKKDAIYYSLLSSPLHYKLLRSM